MTRKNHSLEQELREAMAQEEVPPAVIDYVISLNPSRWFYRLGTWGFIAIIIAGFGVGAILWGKAESIVDANAIARAHEIGGILFRTNFGISFLILMFAWIFAVGLFVSKLTSISPRARATMFAFSFLNPKSRHYLNWGGRLRNIPTDAGPDAYIIAAMTSADKYFWSGALILAAIAVMTLDRELQTYDVYTADAYLATPLFPWEEEKTGMWRDADHVELGCNHVTGKNASDDIIYNVKTNDGATIGLANARPIEGTLLEQLEKLDAALVEAEVPFRRWRRMDRNPLHPDCMEAQQRKLSAEDYSRMIRLLRVGEIPSG